MIKRIVIKVGSHVLTEDGSIAKIRMLALVQLIAELKEHNYEVVLVSSGAVAAGFTQLPLDRGSVANRQALAAIGQPGVSRKAYCSVGFGFIFYAHYVFSCIGDPTAPPICCGGILLGFPLDSHVLAEQLYCYH